jgi:hypothetical protein
MSLGKLVIPVDQYSKRKKIPLCAAGKTCLGLNHEVLQGADPMTSRTFLSTLTTSLFAAGLFFDPAASLFRIFRLLYSPSAIHANSR